MQGRRIFSAFFSYSHLDATATPRQVEPLAAELENIVTARLVNARLGVWRDATHLLTGRRWNDEIESRLRSSDILIVLFSPGWINSDYCRKEYTVFEEVEAGHGSGELVVPILVRPIDDQEEHLDEHQRGIYERLRQRQFYPKLAIGGGRGRAAAIEEVAGHIVKILNGRRNAAIAAQVSADENVPLPMLREILENFGEAGAALDAAAIEARLRAKAGEYAELRDRLNRLSNDDPRVGELRQEAARLIAAADFVAADAALSQAEQRDLGAAEEMEATARQRRLGAAESRAERAAAARLQLDYRAAAGHYAEAAAILPQDETRQRWVYIMSQAEALYDHGNEFGDNAALREAIDLYRESLPLVPRAATPVDWATAQNNLGIALSVLGERESGRARLEEAVAAYRAALEENTRERVPLGWAMTQNNLGNALRVLGERESGRARLEEAVAAYRAALEENTRERVPLDWAMTQNNLGNALRVLGERESGTARLEEAVAALHAALEERTRERVPLHWAHSQHALGHALAVLAERRESRAEMEEAVACMRRAVDAYEQVGENYRLPQARRRVDEMLAALGRLRRATPRATRKKAGS
ncbi:MAG TPA: toll/interleukin-1 receptor domain-containing protein [Stellaceae bacterium]|jgi:tetratricopeptide (TPR) repeat protein